MAAPAAAPASPTAEGNNNPAPPAPPPPADQVGAQVAKLCAEGKKATILKEWEEAVAKYGAALELQWVTGL